MDHFLTGKFHDITNYWILEKDISKDTNLWRKIPISNINSILAQMRIEVN